VLTALINALEDKDFPGVRPRAAYSLGKLGPASKIAVKNLVECFKACDVKDSAIVVEIRINVAWALGEIGQGAKSAVPLLTQALQDSDERVREVVREALDRINRP
jgi:HEAT repeat protein